MGQNLGGRQTTPGRKSGDVFNQSAQGFDNAGRATLAAGRGFAALGGDPRGGLGGRPATYHAMQQANPAAIRRGIAGYMNPYTSQVIDRTGADIQRQTQMGLGSLGDTAAGQGAFGGSRHGIAEGTAIGEGSRALGDISAQMRAQGYDTAAGLAGQDVANRMAAAGANQEAINAQRQFNAGSRSTFAQQGAQNRLQALQGLQSAGAQGASLAGQGMGIGQGLSGQQAQHGAQLQGIDQALMGQSAGMFDQFVGQPLQSTAAILNMLSGNPLTGATTTTQTDTPGLKSQLAGAMGTAARVAGAPATGGASLGAGK